MPEPPTLREHSRHRMAASFLWHLERIKRSAAGRDMPYTPPKAYMIAVRFSTVCWPRQRSSPRLRVRSSFSSSSHSGLSRSRLRVFVAVPHRSVRNGSPLLKVNERQLSDGSSVQLYVPKAEPK